MGDRNYSDSDSDDGPVYVARDPREDRHFDRKQELIWNCKGKVGRIKKGKEPLSIAVVGPPGSGKSSFLNTVFAAFSNDQWEERAKYGEFGRKGKQVTGRLKSFKKEDYYKEIDDYLMPTFLDMTGFEDEETLINKELLDIVFCGKLKEREKLWDVIKYGVHNGVNAVHEKYHGSKYFGIIPKVQFHEDSFLGNILDCFLIPNRKDYHRVNRIIVVCSANPDQPLPQSFFENVTEVTNRERDITLYGVLTQADKYRSSDRRVMEREREFMRGLGIPKTRFARIKNYCPDIDPFLTYEDTIIPSLDVPVLRLMRQVFTEESTDTRQENGKKKKMFVPNLSDPIVIICICFVGLLIGLLSVGR